MSRVFAPAFQDRYYGEQPSVAAGPASIPSLAAQRRGSANNERRHRHRR